MEIQNKCVLTKVDPSDLVDGKFIVPKGIERIASYAFENCADILEEVEFSESVKILNESAFQNCKKLKSIDIPNTVMQINKNCFKNCSSLESVKLPDSIAFIKESAFENCTSLKQIELPKNLNTISDYAFLNCKSIENLNFPKSLSFVGTSAFSDCKSLKNVKFKTSNITSLILKPSVFANCENLEKAVLSNNIFTIDSNLFENCYSLKTVILPDSIHQINESAFENCTSLKTINLPFYLNSISSSTFKGCSELESITIPQEVTVIEDSAFEHCTNLKTVNLSPCTKAIQMDAFSYCINLNEINLPEGLEIIEDSAFYHCMNLSKINIPSSVQTIGSGAFEHCKSLNELFVPKTVISMQDCKFNPLKFFSKDEDGFLLSSSQTDSSLPIENVNVDLALLSNNWNYKDLILRETKNPAINDFYNSFLYNLSPNEIEKFLNSHNFTFFKQLNIDPKLANYDYFKFLYNIGAFEKPIESNGRKIDYAQKIVEFLKEKQSKKIINSNDISKISKKMKVLGFNPEFTEFFMKSFDDLFKENKLQPGFIAKCYNNFEKVQKSNTSNRGEQRQLKATVDHFRNYFMKEKFFGITSENIHIAESISPYFAGQIAFNNALKIDKTRQENNIPNNILNYHLTEESVFDEIQRYVSNIQGTESSILGNLADISNNQFTFDWLEKNDPKNFILGKLCNCCAHLEGVGYGIMKASIIHPNVQNLVIRDKDNNIIAKSTLYINKLGRYGVCNNIEISKSISKEEYEQIYQKFILGIREFAIHYNKEHYFLPLKQINIGMGHNDLDEIKEFRTKSSSILKPIHYSKYGLNDSKYDGDSFSEQYIIWSAKEEKLLKKANQENDNIQEK